MIRPHPLRSCKGILAVTINNILSTAKTCLLEHHRGDAPEIIAKLGNVKASKNHISWFGSSNLFKAMLYLIISGDHS